MNKKHYFSVVFGILLMLFILQNITTVEIRFLFWQLSVSRAIMFFILLVIGMVIGWFLHALYLARRSRRTPR